MAIELSKITAEKLRQLPKAQTVFFFPVAGLEDHGPHLPLGLKIFEARRMCDLAALRLERELSGWVGVVMPDAPLGVDTYTSETTVTVRAHVLRDWLIDSCRSLKLLGFKNFVCFSGHLTPKQLTAIEEAGRMLNPMGAWSELWIPKKKRAGRATLVSACSPLISPKEVWRSPTMADPKEHGGAIDTSMGLDLCPELLGTQYQTLPPVEKNPKLWTRFIQFRAKKINGYWGTPTDARSGEGIKHLQERLDDIFPKLRAVWENSNPNHLFRSWYSIIPLNKGFFKIYLLAFVLLVILWIWAYYAVQGLVN